MRRWSLGTFAVCLCAVLALTACGASNSASGSNGSGATSAAGNGGGGAAAGGGATTINVMEKDFAMTLDKTSVPAGSVTFKMTNMGPSAHNIGVTAADAATKDKGISGTALKEGTVINMGQNEMITVDLKPGTYQVVCTVAGHVQLGMIVPITVT